MSTLSPDLRRALLRIEGVEEGSSIFSDDDSRIGFFVNGKEIAHFEGEDGIELRLTRRHIAANRARLESDDRVTLRRSTSDWITVQCTRRADVSFVAELAELAAAAHRPPAGIPPKPPPMGSELARRRRFH